MDTPKANKLRHEEVVAAAPTSGTRQARGMDTPKANKLHLNKVDGEFATNGTVALVRTGAGERGAHRANALSAAPGVRTLPRPSPTNHAH